MSSPESWTGVGISFAKPKDSREPAKPARRSKGLMQDDPPQDSLFEIDGPDDEGNVWIVSPEGRNVWSVNLGPQDVVAEVMSDWLEQIKYGENE